MRMRVGVAVLVGIAMWARAAAAVVQLEADSVTVAAAGGLAEVCVRLDSGGQEVAGTENRLVWDGSCVSGPSGAEGCYVAGSHGKDLSWNYLAGADFTLKALVLSLSDVDPIPDGELYCCAFTAEAAAGSCCPLSVVAAGASDPQGNALVAEGNDAQVCVAASVGADDDGCQVVAPRGGRGVLPAALGLVGLQILIRWRRSARRHRMSADAG